jgi:signal transduction histidine kinase/sensor domain CHASE-containing protein
VGIEKIVNIHKKKERKNQRTTIIFGAFFAILILGNVIVGIIIAQDQKNSQISNIEKQLNEDMFSAQNEIEHRFTLLIAIKALVDVNSSLDYLEENFDLYAAALHNTTSGIRNFIIAPEGINTFVYPLEGNEAALGHDIMNDSGEEVQIDIARMLETENTIISGPNELRQGDWGIVLRTPIYFNNEFWGLVSMVIDLDSIIENARIVEKDENIKYAIRNDKNNTFFGDPEYFNQTSIILKLNLIDGYWEFTGVPTLDYNKEIKFNILGICFMVVLVSILIFTLVLISYNLSHEIQEKRNFEQTQVKINEERKFLLNIFSSLGDGVYVVNENYEIQYVNPAVVMEFGSWKGEKCYTYFHKRESTCHWCKNDQVFKGETVHWEHYSPITKRTYDLLDTLVINPDGTKSKLEVIRDITEIVKDKKELKKLNEKLEIRVKERTKDLNEALENEILFKEELLKSSQFKSEFMASMSHELRTPLNSIIGFTDVILEKISGELNEEQEEYLDNVKSSGMHLLNLINDILDISKIEAGKLELHIEDVNLSNVINLADVMVKLMYKKKDLKFEIMEIDPNKVIHVDRKKFMEILYNLLSNAIKYTKEGFVKLEILENENEWVFNIIDTGIGISEKDFNLIFKEFKRIKSVYTNSIEGTGLGLPLTKKLVELHGGNISFTSEIGKGSTFTFTIPKKIN